jgi:chromosome partitioning protein
MQCEYYALEGLSVMLRLIEQLRGAANPNLEITGIVMTMVSARTNLGAQVAAEVRQHFPDKIFNTVIPRTVRLAEAPSFGKPIIIYDPHSVATAAYRALAVELLGRCGIAVPISAPVPTAAPLTIVPPDVNPPLAATS